MGSTAGQVTLNSRIFPETPYFRPPARTQPLQAVFQNLRSDGAVKSLVHGIAAYQQGNELFDYTAKITGKGVSTVQRIKLALSKATAA